MDFHNSYQNNAGSQQKLGKNGFPVFKFSIENQFQKDLADF
jgi:hypothetical protein